MLIFATKGVAIHLWLLTQLSVSHHHGAVKFSSFLVFSHHIPFLAIPQSSGVLFFSSFLFWLGWFPWGKGEKIGLSDWKLHKTKIIYDIYYFIFQFVIGVLPRSSFLGFDLLWFALASGRDPEAHAKPKKTKKTPCMQVSSPFRIEACFFLFLVTAIHLTPSQARLEKVLNSFLFFPFVSWAGS